MTHLPLSGFEFFAPLPLWSGGILSFLQAEDIAELLKRAGESAEGDPSAVWAVYLLCAVLMGGGIVAWFIAQSYAKALDKLDQASQARWQSVMSTISINSQALVDNAKAMGRLEAVIERSEREQR